jgi:acetylornithine deacetylase/succinyl-diaminopimelate desuccinylase-like protein
VTRPEEVAALLQELLRANTVNPPGNETRAVEVLERYLAGSGVASQRVARAPERANLLARLAGGDGPTLLLLAHTDTVLADPAAWRHDPWSGAIVDGEVWGRGALDMKGQVAASAVAFASLAREGFEPAGDVILALTADEEAGDGFGLDWLCETHPDLVRCDFAVNEGGGERIVLGDTPYYVVSTAEKATAPFLLRVRGRAGHASMPALADNALVKSAALLEAVAAYRPEPELIPEVRTFFESAGGVVPPADQAGELARRLAPSLAPMLEPLLSATFSPTMIQASAKRNVIPGVVEIEVDCRLLPGQRPADVEPALRAALPSGDWELEWLESRQGGTRSAAEGPLWEAIARFVDETEPGARLLPVCNTGFTDSHWLRDAFGTVAYGFFPLRTMDAGLAAALIHSADERIAVDDLALAVEGFRAVVIGLGAS